MPGDWLPSIATILKILGPRSLTIREGSYKYVQGRNENKPVVQGLSEVSIRGITVNSWKGKEYFPMLFTKPVLP